MKHLISGLLLFSITFSFCQDAEENKTVWTSMWSPNGKYIAAGGSEGILKILDSKSLEELEKYSVNGVILSRVKWHPFENKLAVITQSTTFKAQILDLDSGQWIELKNLENSFRAIDWNFDGSLLAISELGNFVNVYDKAGNRLIRFMGDDKGVADLDWHPTKNTLVTVGSRIGIYNYEGGLIDTIHAYRPFELEHFLLSVEWHNSGKFFAVGDYGELDKAERKSLSFWNTEANLLLRNDKSLGEYRNIRWNADGEQLATATDQLSIFDKKGSLLYSSPSFEDYLWGVDWSPDGKQIVSSNDAGVITIWNAQAEIIKQIQF